MVRVELTGRKCRCVVRRIFCRANLGQSEVENLGVPSFGYEYVSGLDVPVDDALRVSCIEGIRDIDRHTKKLVEFHRSARNQVLQ